MLLPHRGEVWYRLHYGDEREEPGVEPPVGLPCWLLTNKAILSTGLKQLFTRATWSWNRASNHKFGRDYDYQRQSPLTDLSVATNCSLTGVPCVLSLTTLVTTSISDGGSISTPVTGRGRLSFL
jgi:hypothetical protein